MEKDNKSSNSIGLSTILFLIFLTLKLGGWGVVATWSWWWVCSPLWIPLVMVGIISLVVFVIAFIFGNL